MDERRKQQRMRAYMGAVAQGADRLRSQDCLVRNLSSAGARVDFGGPCVVGDEFELRFPARDALRRAKIAWMKGKEAGVAFVEEDARPVRLRRRTPSPAD